MAYKKRKSSIDPVIIVTLGVVFVAISIALFVFQPNLTSINFASGSGVMSRLIVAFITGISTGGLSCLAVQGGLLASSLAHQIEQDYLEQTVKNKKTKQKPIPRLNSAFPIFLFLVAKITAYTLLGALLVFIPCGITQAMMATALGTGSMAMGAALMFAFVLGTSPIFFIVAYL